MNEQSLEGMTLASWAGGVWNRYRRGIPLIGLEGALGQAMDFHTEWRPYWDTLETTKDPDVSRLVLHVHHDAMVKLQIDVGNPQKIKECYEQLLNKQFKEFEAIHTIVVAFTEELWQSRSGNSPFDLARYVQKAEEYTRVALQRPTWVRTKHER